jgi:hypothetical protein
MANEEHVKILKQGVEKWNEWRRANRSDLLRNGADVTPIRGQFGGIGPI